MSTARLLVTHPGALTTVQDTGRTGWRAQGVPTSGALHAPWLRAANVLAGNAAAAPALEAIGGGLSVQAEGAALRVAVAGPCAVALDGVAVASWRAFVLQPGQRLRLGAPRAGRVAYLAVHGLQLEPVLGSTSTCLRAGFGGHLPQAGRALQAGDALAASAANDAPPAALAEPPPDAEADPGAAPLRAVPGPQADHFTPEQLAAFWAATWTVTREADRMGLRLAGPRLVHRTDDAARGAEIVTDATALGAIQVPGHGQPIVLLADGHTAGGYPKIATVCRADLPRLAVAAPGAVLRFAPITVAKAHALLRAQTELWSARLAALVRAAPTGGIDEAALYATNLISGAVDAAPGLGD